MPLKILKPSTPSQRGTVLVDKSNLWKGKPFKSLVKGSKSTAGRNNQGRITSRRMGSGVKRNYRLIDFKRDKNDILGNVERIEYDPFRSAFISLIKYDDGEYRYIIAPQNLKINDKIICALGGNTSIDIYPKGWDKTFALNYYSTKNNTCWFIGDKCDGKGNDRSIYEALNKNGTSFKTKSPKDTIRIIRENILPNIQ